MAGRLGPLARSGFVRQPPRSSSPGGEESLWVDGIAGQEENLHLIEQLLRHAAPLCTEPSQDLLAAPETRVRAVAGWVERNG